MLDLSLYGSIVFDCDGVILNSNYIKSSVFDFICSKYVPTLRPSFINYVNTNGGLSRFEKFYYLKNTLAKAQSLDYLLPNVNELCDLFSSIIYQKLLTCQMTRALPSLRIQFDYQNWFVVSGSFQDELRLIFKERHLDSYFSGIFGSPLSKFDIIDKLFSDSLLSPPILFIGDSLLDYNVSLRFGFDFLFVSSWSMEKKLFKQHFCNSIESLDQLVLHS